ncbi:hypothetical protein L198_00373 [Cryptococcus wingfieldii CBS 7118]|uniref:Uncharacterized protein n=1 Tax=Cryptococcus wingfieldii CBS 7118 TaxID=1295528 RepID=A0A1E3K6F1_9TREE|nr:hypothetical protein L198_00373 [Cryptococcus wingfieldii CBS 7118]ODO08641.1 hypothetical protein L198_00373 [Cryptococcus wingfieldii CBS 7118]
MTSSKLLSRAGTEAQARRGARGCRIQQEAQFIEEKKPSWDAVAINPPYVLGEIIHQCDKPESLNTSVAAFYE